MLLDSNCFHRNAGIESMEGRIPNKNYGCQLSACLEEHQTVEQNLEVVKQMLSKKGVMIREDAFFATTITKCPSPMKNKRKERDSWNTLGAQMQKVVHWNKPPHRL